MNSNLRKFFAASLMFSTVLTMSGAVVSPAKAAASAGDLIKRDGLQTVYYLGSDNKRYVFPSESVFFSWYNDFSGVVTVSSSELESYGLAANVTMRPGTKLIKITSDPKVYAVENGGVLRHISDEATATALYGADWGKRVVDVDDSYFTNYKSGGAAVTSASYPAGSLVKYSSSATDVYYVNADGTVSKVANEAAFMANRFKSSDILTAPSTMTMPTKGAEISAAVASIINTGSSASNVGVAPGAGTGLSVALASDTPVATSYIRDTGAFVAQAVAPFAKYNFTASNDGDVKVTSLKLTRSGISSDTDLGTVYLYDGETEIAQNTSLSSKIVTFSNTSGLFTVAKGTTKSITVKSDISALSASVSGIVLGIASASDVVATGATVSGTFPANGNQMAVGTVGDLGYVNVSSFTTYPATIDPGKTNQELWRFNVQANDQDMLIQKMKLTVVGTISASDLANIRLEVAGVQVGSTIASLNTANEAIFDLASSNYKVTSGQTKTFVVKGDVVSGSARAFKFTIRKVGDLIVKDNNYGVYVAPLVSGGAFTLVEPTSGSGTAINAGSLTISVASDSPSGNIASAATGVTLGKFEYKATGEDVKVSYVRVTVNEEVEDIDLKNGKLYYNGSQVASTDSYVQDETAEVYNLGNSVIIPAGTTGIFEYKADVVHGGTGGSGTGATGVGLALGQTIVVSLGAATTDATGQSSLSSVATAAATGRTLTVAVGGLSVAKNLALADYGATTPAGVKGATNIKVGSFALTAGAGEPVSLTQVVVGDLSGGDAFGSNFQNLKLMNGTTQLGTTQGTLSATAGADYTFSISPAVTIAAGAQYVIDAYADILTGAAGYTGAGAVGLDFVSASATGVNTSSDASISAGSVSGQNVVIATAGSLTVTVDSTTPLAQQIVMGQTGVEMAKLKFSAGTSEDVNISRIKLKNTGTQGTSLTNIALYDGTTLLGTINSFDAAANGYAELTLPTNLVITKGASKVITVKADVNASPNAVSYGTQIIGIALPGDIDTLGASSGTSITEIATAIYGNTMTVVKTKLTIAKASDTLVAARAADTPIAYINLVNTSNVATQDATLTDMAVTLSLNSFTTVAAKAMNVYKNSISTGNLVGTTPNLASVALGGWASGTLTDVVVASGGTVKLIVAADTTGATTGAGVTAVVSTTIPATAGVTWTDGESASIPTVDTLPITFSLSGIQFLFNLLISNC